MSSELLYGGLMSLVAGALVAVLMWGLSRRVGQVSMLSGFADMAEAAWNRIPQLETEMKALRAKLDERDGVILRQARKIDEQAVLIEAQAQRLNALERRTPIITYPQDGETNT